MGERCLIVTTSLQATMEAAGRRICSSLIEEAANSGTARSAGRQGATLAFLALAPSDEFAVVMATPATRLTAHLGTPAMHGHYTSACRRRTREIWRKSPLLASPMPEF